MPICSSTSTGHWGWRTIWNKADISSVLVTLTVSSGKPHVVIKTAHTHFNKWNSCPKEKLQCTGQDTENDSIKRENTKNEQSGKGKIWMGRSDLL